MEDKVAKLEELLENEQSQNEAALSVRLREASVIEEKIETLRDPVTLEERIAVVQRQCTTLEALQLKHQEETISTKKAVQDEISECLIAMAKYEDHIESKFGELHNYKLDKLTTLTAIPMRKPSSSSKE